MLDILEFEKPIFALEEKIRSLQKAEKETAVNLTDKIKILEKKLLDKKKEVFCRLKPWQIVSLSRHINRPHTVDLLSLIFPDFEEIHGDRVSGDCKAIVGGIASLNGQSVVIVGQEKGRDTKDKVYRNFAMVSPAGFRKANRLFKLAEKFKMPLITFLDSPGAYAGIDAELNNQSEAIATNLLTLCQLKTPVISVVIGEAMSGGAMAIGVCDYCAMLEYSIYSVISPEGCASILWKDAGKAEKAANAMQLTAKDLMDKSLIDLVIEEPLGGAHNDYKATSESIKKAITEALGLLQSVSLGDLLKSRYKKWMMDHL